MVQHTIYDAVLWYYSKSILASHQTKGTSDSVATVVHCSLERTCAAGPREPTSCPSLDEYTFEMVCHEKIAILSYASVQFEDGDATKTTCTPSPNTPPPVVKSRGPALARYCYCDWMVWDSPDTMTYLSYHTTF